MRVAREVLSRQLRRVIKAEHPRKRRVDLNEPAVQASERHPGGRIVKPTVEQLVTRAKRLLDPLAFGDITDVASDAHNAAVVDHRPADRAHPDPLPIGADQPELEIVRHALGHQPLERRIDDRRALGIVGRDRLRDLRRIGRRSTP